MRFTFSLLSIALSLLFCERSQAQSWCGEAKTEVELAICQDISLGRRDEMLSQLFARLRDSAGDKQAAVDEQRAFLKRRNACGSDAACIAQQYDRQISVYIQGAQQAGGAQPDAAIAAPALRAGATTAAAAEKSLVDTQEVRLALVSMDFGELGGAGNAMDALVVANSDYAELDDLKTPDADAELVSSALKARGIHTKIISGASRAELDVALASFKSSPRKEVFIFYYAGHAATIGGNSSLILPNFGISDGKSNGEYEPISEITNRISELGYKKALIVFDACRNIIDVDDTNVPPAVVVQYENTRGVKALASRSVELVALQDMDYAISFSSAEGQTALDTVNGTNSPFADAFAFNVRDKKTFFEAIIETRRTVRQLTSDRQRPTLEMSWDEDLALSSNLIKSVTYRFLEPFEVIVGRPNTALQPDTGLGAWEKGYQLFYRTTDKDGCALAVPTPGSVSFTSSSFDCLKGIFQMSVRQNTITGAEMSFPTYTTRERDSSYGRCEDATFVLDLDSDGRAETAKFGSNRYGGYLQFIRDGHTATYYSQLGCSFSDITIYDLDKNGVADLVISYACGDESGECLVALSGERLVSNVDGDFYSGDDDRFEKIFRRSEYLGVLSGLNTIALYYDQNVKAITEISPSGLRFSAYSKTWEDIPDNYMPNKKVVIGRDGTIDLVSDDQQFRISAFQRPGITVERVK